MYSGLVLNFEVVLCCSVTVEILQLLVESFQGNFAVLYLSSVLSVWFSVSCLLLLLFICLLGSTSLRSWSLQYQLIHLLVRMYLHTQLTYQKGWCDHIGVAIDITLI